MSKPIRSSKSSSRRRRSSETRSLVNVTSLSNHTIFPPRYTTKLCCSYAGSLAVASAGQQFSVYGNSFLTPYTTANPASTANPAALTPRVGSLINQPFIGGTQLGNIYATYRVLRSRIVVCCTPGSAVDNVVLVVLPTPAYTANVIYNQLAGNRWSRDKMCTASNNVIQNTISHQMRSCDVLGMTASQYVAQTPIAITAAPAASYDWYWEIFISTLAGNVLTAVLDVTIKLEIEIEFNDPYIFNA